MMDWLKNDLRFGEILYTHNVVGDDTYYMYTKMGVGI